MVNSFCSFIWKKNFIKTAYLFNILTLFFIFYLELQINNIEIVHDKMKKHPKLQINKKSILEISCSLLVALNVIIYIKKYIFKFKVRFLIYFILTFNLY